MSNRERILETSLKLFNELGVADVGTNRIAAHMGISPGNLYYHFKNKDQIIRDLFPRISDAIDGVLSHVKLTDEPVDAPTIAIILRAWMNVLWDYRFFFGNLVYLLRADPELRKLYGQRRARTLAVMQAAFSASAQIPPDMRNEDGRDILLANGMNVWIVALNWIQYLQVSVPDTKIRKGDIDRGAYQIFALMAPYMDANLRRDVASCLNQDMN